MTKTQRQHRISELLEREVISTAAQLVLRLQAEDISATQATVTSATTARRSSPSRTSTSTRRRCGRSTTCAG